MFKCLHISDIHGFHEQLKIKDNKYDYIFITGDVTNSSNTNLNRNELDSFLAWISNVKVKHEIIMIPGNHDVSIERLQLKNYVESFGIKCLIHESYEIKDNRSDKTWKIFGSPYTPSYGIGWAYNRDRGKLSNYWKDIPLDTDILLTHGPPKGILDLSYSVDNKLEFCGDKELLNRINQLTKLKYHMFGHIHDCKDIENYGVLCKRINSNGITFFRNSAVVKDGKFDLGIIHQGDEFYII